MKEKKPIIIAEIGSVHDGSLGNACKLIELAKDCGANAVKFQLHDAENETALNAPNPKYFNDESRYQYFKRTAFNASQLVKLKRLAKKNKLKFIVSPFSLQAAELLNKIKIDVFKIASGEVTNHPLLSQIKKYNKEVYLSTGMSNWKEIDNAIKILGKIKTSILQCTSEYPCKPKNVGLNVIDDLIKRYNLPVGLSDHTTGYAASIAAIVKGCNIIEKHFTFTNKMY